jgi:CubicO group peptidase (beta-lactamase class C family)
VILPQVRQVLEEGVREGVAPGAAAVVLAAGRAVHASAHGDAQVVPTRRRLAPSERFDLASLTKLHVASAAARLLDRGRLELDAPVARWLPAFGGAKHAITLRHLLAHASGLPAWRPYHERVARDPVAAPAFLPPQRRPGAERLTPAFRRGRELVEEALSAEPLEGAPGTAARYSDLGFLALGFALERIAGVPLDVLVETEVTAPLGLAETSFRPGVAPAPAVDRPGGAAAPRGGTAPTFAATRAAPARGGAVLCGEVDDDNAWALGGVAGHAGLFATVRDVAAFGQAWLDALAGRSRWLSPAAAERFVARDPTPGSERALGWDTPSRPASAIGRWLGQGRRGAVGHLGFTGTSLWLDLDRELACALLTNHVHPRGGDRARVQAFRARFHDAVAEGLGWTTAA